MADNFLITGYWGEPHITAENDRGINAAIFGTGRFVLPVGEQFRAEYIGNNTIRMYDGKLLDNGAAAGIPAGEYVDLLITNAGQGMKRNDLIVFQYEQDGSTLVESGRFVVVQGTETSGTATDPELTQEDLLSNEATFDQMALWRVSVSGTAISAPVAVFSQKCLATTEYVDAETEKNNTLIQQTNKTVAANKAELSESLDDCKADISGLEDLINSVKQTGLVFKRILTSQDNLDNVLETGIYAFSTASMPANSPFENASVVEVFGSTNANSQKVQRIYRYGVGGHSAYRTLYDGAWHKWAKNPIYYEVAIDLVNDTPVAFTNEQTAAQLFQDLENSVPVIVATSSADSTAARYFFEPTRKNSGEYFLSCSMGFSKLVFSLSATTASALSIEVIADRIIEKGTSGDWNYRKWASGKMEAWGKLQATVTSSTASGSAITGLYIIQAEVPFPSGMLSGEANTEYYSLQARNYRMMGNMSGVDESGNKIWGRFTTYASGSSAYPEGSTNFPVHAFLIGKWQ